MNKNNIKPISTIDFLKIINGEQPGYIGPQRSNQNYTWRMSNEAMRQSGLEPEINISFPVEDNRYLHKVKHYYQNSGVPPSYWPDFEKPIIQLIEGSIYLNRGANMSTGEGPKPELDFGFDLSRCYFKTILSVREVQSKGALLLYGCKFEKYKSNDYNGDYLSIQKSKFRRVEIYNISAFQDELFIPLYSINLADIITKTIIAETCIVDNMIINGEFNLTNEIFISESTIHDLQILKLPTDVLELKNNKINKASINDANASVKKVNISGNNIELLEIYELESSSLMIINSNISTLKILCTVSCLKNIYIKNCQIKNIEINGQNYVNCRIEDINEVDNFLLDAQFKNFSISNEDLKKGEAELTKKDNFQNFIIKFKNQSDKGEYFIKNLEAKSLKLTGVNNGSILLRDSSIDKLHIEDFSNLGDLRLHNVDNIKYFLLKDASLGKAELMNFDANIADSVSIVRSNISETNLSNTLIPDTVMARDAKDYSGLREIFRQLKLASIKQSNRIQELRYEALEMDAYKLDTSHKSYGEMFILYSNKLSNNHGQSWVRASGWLFVFSFILYVSIKISLGYTFVFGALKSQDIREYFELVFNPLHDFTKVFAKDYQDNSILPEKLELARLIDIASKLISGYFLFQLLRAFRKYVK